MAATAQLLYEAGANIVHADQHLDPGRRSSSSGSSSTRRRCTSDRATLEQRLARLTAELGMSWRLVYADQIKRTAILVSRQDHCLYDLLLRWRSGELGDEFVAVISNHPDTRRRSPSFGLPFHHLPVTPATRGRPRSELLELLGGRRRPARARPLHADPLRPASCDELGAPAINIHHSFLPAFVGADPYHRGLRARASS